MPFDANGVFHRLFSWQQDRDNGIAIQSDRMDLEMDGMVQALNDISDKLDLKMDGLVQALNDILQGNETFNAPLKIANGHVLMPSLTFADHPETGLYCKSDGSIGVAIDNKEIGIFSASFFKEITKYQSALEERKNVPERHRYFYGMRGENDHLILDVGTEDYIASQYLWFDIIEENVNYLIDDNGHLIGII